ncbi:MAG: tetratricopeptide repeat protein [Candidatus Heimdallarchaeota archaeon]|nr:tetratricopeptide repeat protein [Candidatus Heimdallarchaeota archaeon]
MLHTKISYLLTLSRYEEAFSLIKNDVKTNLTEKMLLRSRIFEKQGEFEKAIQLLDEVIRINQVRSRVEYTVIANLLKASVYASSQDKQKAINLIASIDTSVLDSLESGVFWQGTSDLIYGNIFFQYGSYDKSLKFYEEAVAKFEKIDDNYSLIGALNNIGEVHKLRGELDTAREYYNRCLLFFKHEEIGLMKAIILTNLGEISFLEGNNELAIEFLLKSLNMKLEVAPLHSLAYTLFQLLIVFLEIKDLKKAKEIKDFIEEIKERKEIPIVTSIRTLAEAVYLKNSNRMIDIAKSQELFVGVARTEIIASQYRIFAILNLSGLLITELKVYESEEIFKELNHWLYRLMKIGQVQQLNHLIGEIILIQSQVSVLQGDTEKAIKKLNEGIELASQNGMVKLMKKISSEKEKLFTEMDNAIDFEAISVRDKLDKMKIGEYLQTIIKNKDIYQ